MRNSARKIAMVLDNCTAHPNINGLININLMFLPTNTTAKTWPLDSGVTHCLKTCYRKSLAKMCLLAFAEKRFYSECSKSNESSQTSIE